MPEAHAAGAGSSPNAHGHRTPTGTRRPPGTPQAHDAGRTRRPDAQPDAHGTPTAGRTRPAQPAGAASRLAHTQPHPARATRGTQHAHATPPAHIIRTPPSQLSSTLTRTHVRTRTPHTHPAAQTRCTLHAHARRPRTRTIIRRATRSPPRASTPHSHSSHAPLPRNALHPALCRTAPSQRIAVTSAL
ncbi:mucin-1-like, partial [Penaeus indicus]|uniref:mucin-1-like n=1 Tax=Penaeus indicus TaxID=29960 RepID=UPI00300D801B